MPTLKVAAGIVALLLIGWAVHTVNGWRTDAAQLPIVENTLKDERDALATQQKLDKAQAAIDAANGKTDATERARIAFERDMLLQAVADLKARGALTVTKVIHDAQTNTDAACPDLSAEWLRNYNRIATGSGTP